jgi:hypothetical protein
MTNETGTLHKMVSTLASPINYEIRLSDTHIPLNENIGKQISLTFTGNIHCIQCNRKTKKSFQQGLCFPCLRRLMECNLCVIHPERCNIEHGTCPENDWAHAQCNAHHIVYLANSSALKVGVTRDTQVPTRWIDQGALQALPIFTTSNRYQAGVIEVCLKKYVNDKTNWRAMLKGNVELLDLAQERDRLLEQAKEDLAEVIKKFPASDVNLANAEAVSLSFPTHNLPEKIKSLSLDKTPCVEGVLESIKGQYLLLDTGVINIRKFGGYEINVVIK